MIALLLVCRKACVFIVSAVSLTSVTEGKQFEVTKSTKMVRKPEVECNDRLCVFKDRTNSWCFKSTPPMLKIGWEFEQFFEETSDSPPIKYWKLNFIPYYEAAGYIQSIFDV
jgi:hypothetical protein